LIPLRDNLPTDRFPVVTVVIIAINVIVFVFFQGPSFSFSGADAVDAKTVVEYGAVPYRITHPGKGCDIVPAENTTSGMDTPVCEGTPEFAEAQAAGVVQDLDEPPAFLTIFTSMFMHGGWLHLGGNMLYLWIFGDNVEDRLGKIRFFLYYVASGLSAVYIHYLTEQTSGLPVIGASGAIAGIMGGYFVLFPHSRILTLVPIFIFVQIVTIPAVWFLALWFLGQLLSGIVTSSVQTHGGVAWWAHVGGFAAGALLIFLLRQSMPNQLSPTSENMT